MTTTDTVEVSSAFFAVLRADNPTKENILYNKFIDILGLALKHLPDEIYYKADATIMDELDKRLDSR